MDFAKKFLTKYGWKEGDGLGKNNDGISKPLKASLKFDTTGFGTDKAQEFNNHWWERVFNEAADNVKVNTDGDKITMELKNEDSVEISTKQYSVRKLKNINGDSYNNFLKQSTLTKEGSEQENPHKIQLNDIAVKTYKSLTDEELFAACGGRTAHKGARHGLNLSGKLARIAAQEEELLAKMQNDMERSKEGSDAPWTAVKSKKRKKSKSEETVESPVNSEKIDEILFNADYSIKSKKKKKKKTEVDNDLSACLETFTMENEENSKDNLLGLSDSSKAIKKSKKNKKKRVSSSNGEEWKTFRASETNDEIEEQPDLDKEEILPSKKSKKIKLKSIDDDVEIEELPVPDEEGTLPSKKSKKMKSKCKDMEAVLSGGVEKKRKDDKKKAKKLKKSIANITESLKSSALITVEA